MTFRMFVRALSTAAALGCGSASESPAQSDTTAPALTSRDPAVQEAAAALAAQRPLKASRLLAPALTDARRRTPEAVLLAARADAALGMWGEVERHLASEPWVDSVADGEGRELLARAALERGNDTLAVRLASRAVERARTERERGVRSTLLARALDRLAIQDSARATYERAAELLPRAADWLRLRAAGMVTDSARRARLYATLRTEVARSRVAATEAQTLERWGDLAAAARAYAALGSPATALRLRLKAAPDSATRATIRREAVALVETRGGSAEATAAIALLDSAFAPLAPAEELVVARSAARSGTNARAATGFARADQGGVALSGQDRFTWGTTLARLGRDREAVAQLERVTAPASLAARAAYERARSLLRASGVEAARGALRTVTTTFAQDTEVASSALYLLADLATDEGRDPAARQTFLSVVTSYPTSTSAPRALFRAAIIAYVAGSYADAARELDTLWRRYPSSDEVLAAGYWSGRAWEKAGDAEQAHRRWREVIAREPMSYYSGASARRLQEPAWTPAAARDSFATLPAVDSAMARATLLQELGMDTEEQLEYDRLLRDAQTSVPRLLATASAFRARGLTSPTIALTQRAIAQGAPRDARVLRLLYPLVYDDVLRADAAAQKVDPALVAGLIRQESNFNPRARSRAGALGMMQVMPDVGRQVASALGLPEWRPSLLFQPEINIDIGVRHLKAALGEYPNIPYALAAYNAGGSRVARWRTKAGVADSELFTERIPFVETRDYVRIVQRNAELYRVLYEW